MTSTYNKIDDYKEFQIEKVNSLANISSIQTDWCKLLLDNNSKNPYLDPNFYKNLFNSRAGNAKPQIILFRKKSLPKALIIGWLKKIRIPLKLGYLNFHSPGLESFEIEIDGIITDKTNESNQIVSKYLRELLVTKEIELINANHFSFNNIFFNEFKSVLGSSKNVVSLLGLEWTAKIRNTETGIKEISHSAETEKKLAKQDRRILKFFDQELKIKVIKSIDEIDFFIKEAEKISKKSYHLALGVGIKDNEYWKNMFMAMANGGYFRGYLLFAQDIPIAYYQGVLYKDIYYGFYKSYNLDYRKLSPGTYLFRKVVDSLVDEKVNTYHFGYGDAEFKQFYGTECEEEASFRIYGFTFSAMITRILNKATTNINDSLLEVVRRFGLLNKVKKYWRSKLLKN